MAGSDRVSFARLDRRVDRAAAMLQAAGVRKGDRVGLLLRNGLAYCELFYALGRIGAICCALNHRLSAAETAHILRDSGAALTIHDPLFDATVAGLRDEGTDCAMLPVPMFHVGGLSFTVHFAHAGATLVIPPAWNAEDILTLIETEGVNHFFAVPTMIGDLASAAGFAPERLRSVRWIMSGAAPLPARLVDDFAAIGVPIQQSYGATETCGPAACMDMASVGRKRDCVGLPFFHTDIRVVRGEVAFRVLPDANSTVAELRAGSADIALVRPQQIPALEGGGIAISAVDQPSVYYVALTNDKDPFQDVRVRRALNHAVDKDGIIRAVVDGYATVATGMIAPSVEGYTADVRQYPYDPAEAKRLLAEAGWEEVDGKLAKDGEPMKVELVTSTGVIGGPQLAQIIQQQFGDIGVEAEIRMVEFRDLWVGVFDGQFQTSVEYLNLQPSADITNAVACGGSQNRFKYCDEALDRLLAEASALSDPAARDAKYAEVQAVTAENPPGIWLYYPKEIRAISERVKGFPGNPIRMATTHLFDVTVED